MLQDYYTAHPVGDHPKKFNDLKKGDYIYRIVDYSIVAYKIWMVQELTHLKRFLTSCSDNISVYSSHYSASVENSKFPVPERFYADYAVAKLELEKYKLDQVRDKELQIKRLQQEIDTIKNS